MNKKCQLLIKELLAASADLEFEAARVFLLRFPETWTPIRCFIGLITMRHCLATDTHEAYTRVVMHIQYLIVPRIGKDAAPYAASLPG